MFLGMYLLPKSKVGERGGRVDMDRFLILPVSVLILEGDFPLALSRSLSFSLSLSLPSFSFSLSFPSFSFTFSLSINRDVGVLGLEGVVVDVADVLTRGLTTLPKFKECSLFNVGELKGASQVFCE
jgi:hypothetical protein